jgi:hypothetical protein
MLARISLLALLLAASPLPAFAVSQDINLTATVTGTCTVSDSLTPSAINQALTINSDGTVSQSPVTVTFPVACNKPASLNMASANKALVGPAAVPNYANTIVYRAVASGGVFPDIELTSDNSAPQPPVFTSGPAAGNISLTITPFTTQPLAAGSYADTLRVTIEPVQ